jgi:hypothetical protein
MRTGAKKMAAVMTALWSPIPPTKGTNLESKHNLGVIEEGDEDGVMIEAASDDPDAFMLVPRLQVCTQSSIFLGYPNRALVLGKCTSTLSSSQPFFKPHGRRLRG